MAPYLSVEELEGRYRRAQEPHERSWWQILWLLARRYNTPGPDAMRNRQRLATGGSYQCPMLLSAEQQDDLRYALTGAPPGGSGAGEVWTARAVAEWMSVRLGRLVAVQRGWDYLQRLRHSP